MQSLMKKRTISEIIARRQSQRTPKDPRQPQPHALATSQLDTANEFRMEAFLKKSNYNNEDKFLLLRYIEKRERLRFDPAFANVPMHWLQAREKQVIDKHFDSTRKSYFLLRGRIAVCQRCPSDLRETSASEKEGRTGRKYEEVGSVEAERGIGALFSSEVYQRAVLVGENLLALVVEHGEEELGLVQRNCVMTNDEKQAFVRGFTLFRRLDNINKYYTPFFRVSRHNKGDFIYPIDANPHCLYLIADGEVEFQSRVPHPELPTEDEAISRLILRNCWENFLLVTTEIVGKGNYFGEEEILADTPRRQNARCLSLSCVLVEVPLEKLQKLLFYNDFRQALENSAQSKSAQRGRKIDNFLTHRGPPTTAESQEKVQQSIAFEQFNEAIFQACSERASAPRRLSLKDRRTKILHGSALRLNPPTRTKQETFSMLQVNAQMYHSSAKRFRALSVDEQKRRRREKGVTGGQMSVMGGERGREGRSLKQIWQVLKLENVIQEEERVGIENTEGKAYFNAHMRLTRHIRDVKSYRPKTISSNCRVKTEFVEYLHRIA